MAQQRLTMTRRRLVAGAAAAWAASTTRLWGQARDKEAPPGWRTLRAGPALRRDGEAPSATFGYDGAVPGPVLRVGRGDEVRVRLVNELGEHTALHWRGVRLTNAMDGVPHLTQPPVARGESFDYVFVAPDAGTFWYGPPEFAAGELDRGLAGALVVAESEPVAVDRDLALVLAGPLPSPPDPSRDAGASRPDAGDGPRGLTINGRPSLELPVKTNERLRLRLVNASRLRPVPLRFDQHRVTVMAVDGQPAEPFAARDARVLVGPGSRLDVFLDMALAPGSTASALAAGGEAPLVRFSYDQGRPIRESPLPDPAPLPANGLPTRIELRNALRFDVAIDAASRPWTDAVTAAAGRYGPPLFSTRRGRTVVMAFANRAAAPAVLHLHGHHARLLDNLDDGWKPFWLDTVMVAPQQTARLAFVADNPGKWLIHCALLTAADAGRAVWFEVT